MIWLLAFAGIWAGLIALFWIFMAGATRLSTPDPEPIMSEPVEWTHYNDKEL